MAIITRNYVVRGPTQNYLQSVVSPTVTVDDRYPLRILKISVDDSLVGVLDTLDEVMQAIGYDNELEEPVYEVFERPAVPAILAGIARVYGRAANGGTQLFVRTGTGEIVQLTPHQSPTGYMSGCIASYVSANVVQISAGRVRDVNDTMDLVLAAPANIDIAVAGLGGLDTGVENASAWYYLYVIGDSNGVNPTGVIMSESTIGPTFPAGYDRQRRVGTVRNQASNFRDFISIGQGSTRDVQYRDAITAHQVLTAGNATVVTEILLQNHIPLTCRVARCQAIQAGTVEARLYFDGAYAIGNYQRIVRTLTTVSDLVMPTSATRRIAYANAAAGGLLDVWVTGYQETL